MTNTHGKLHINPKHNKKTEKHKYYIGLAALVIAAVFLAGSNVAFGRLGQTISPLLLALIAFIITAIFFGILNKFQFPKPITKDAIFAIFALNIASACVFIFFYFGLKYLEPSIASALQSSTTPLVAILIAGWLLSYHPDGDQASASEWMGSFIILAGASFLIWTIYSGYSGLGNTNSLQVSLGLGAVIISGISTVFLTIFTKHLIELGWTILNILGHRFYITVLASAILWYLSDGLISELSLQSTNVLTIVVICFLGVTIPIYFLQIGIRNVTPFGVIVMTNCSPIFTFFLQTFDERVTRSWSSLLGIALVLVGVIYVVYHKSKTMSQCT